MLRFGNLHDLPPDAALLMNLGNTNWPRACGVVVPCLDEARVILDLVRGIREILPTVVVVDDGSRDATAALAKRAGAIVLRNEQSQGKGAALQRGFAWLRSSGFSWGMSMDGDGQHSPDDMRGFLDAAETGQASLWVGNRMEAASGMPWLRRQTNRWMSRQLSLMLGRPLPDSQCGFRLLRLDAWSRMRFATARFEYESEMLARFAAAGETIGFVPVRVIYAGERSKINPLSDAWRWLRWRQRARREWRATESAGIAADSVLKQNAAFNGST